MKRQPLNLSRDARSYLVRLKNENFTQGGFMKHLVGLLIMIFLSSILVAGCGKPEEPKGAKPAAQQAAPEKKEAEKQETEKKEGKEAAKAESKPRETQAGEAKPAVEKPGDEKK
jgi:hypothetical protein